MGATQDTHWFEDDMKGEVTGQMHLFALLSYMKVFGHVSQALLSAFQKVGAAQLTHLLSNVKKGVDWAQTHFKELES